MHTSIGMVVAVVPLALVAPVLLDHTKLDPTLAVVVVGSLAVTMSVYCLAAASMYSMALEAVAGST
jgi:hypothetical protein